MNASKLPVLALFAFGCAGARTNVVAPTAEYPISMSAGVRDAGGELVSVSRREVVGHFTEERTAWSLLYSFVSLTPTKDLSKELNAQIKAVNGDAIVNLRVASSPCATSFVPIVDLLPIWPGCSKVTITGDIIRISTGVAAK